MFTQSDDPRYRNACVCRDEEQCSVFVLETLGTPFPDYWFAANILRSLRCRVLALDEGLFSDRVCFGAKSDHLCHLYSGLAQRQKKHNRVILIIQSMQEGLRNLYVHELAKEVNGGQEVDGG